MDKDLVEIGYSNGAHGIRGSFKFMLHSGNDSCLEAGMTVTLFPKDGSSSSVKKEGEEFKVKKISYGNKIIADLEGVATRNQVEEMIPFMIYLHRADFPELEDGEFYIGDMIGAEVVDEAGNFVGRVRDIDDNGVQDIFVIDTDDRGVIEVLNVPVFVKDVDVEAKKLTIVVPEVISERE